MNKLNKILTSLILLAVVNQAFARTESPFESSVNGLTIPNSHFVNSELILRGQTPRNLQEYQQLKDLGVSRVLIFKNETRNEVQTEIQTLKSLNIVSKHLPFPWKEITDFTPVCESAKAALTWIKNNEAKNIKTYFHCTVGEDRTGVLAALLLLVDDESLSVKEVYSSEMCNKGYEAGDPNKDAAVSQTVRDNLNPVFLKMAYLIKKSERNISAINCQYDFKSDSAFQKSIYNRPTSFQCH